MVLLVGIPLVLAGVTWFFLPTIVAPADTEWVMVAPDAERGQEVREAVQSQFVGMSPGERTTLRLEEADLNQLLANAISEGLRTEPEATEAAPQGRFRIDDGVLYLDVRVTIPEGTTGIPARLQGEPTGMQLGLAPRAAGNAVSMRVREVRLGRVPIPVGVAMSLLARTRAADGLPFLDPDTGELRVSLQQLGPMAEGVTLHDLSVGDGALRLDVSR